MQTTLWTKCIRYERHGPATQVLYLCTVPIDPALWDDNAVLVRWLASPVNPIDLNIVEGTYTPIRPRLPAIAGCEAVGVVERVGSRVEHLRPDDRVVRWQFDGQGVWTEWAIVQAHTLQRIHPHVNLVSAATLVVNPLSALAMLREFVALRAGDCLIQNAANSGVGRAVIQLAKHFGYRTINLVRNRPDIEALKQELRTLGADWVFSEEEFSGEMQQKRNGNAPEGSWPEPRLALNGVGGTSALLLSCALCQHGTMVTYGGMSKRPSQIAAGALIFRDIRVHGFSQFAFTGNPANAEKVRGMIAELEALVLVGELRPPPARLRPMAEHGEAVAGAIGHGTKQILLMADRDELQRRASKL